MSYLRDNFKTLRQRALASDKWFPFKDDLREFATLKKLQRVTGRSGANIAYNFCLLLDDEHEQLHPSLMEDLSCICSYACFIKQAKWLEVEPLLKQDETVWRYYASYFKFEQKPSLVDYVIDRAADEILNSLL